MALTIFSLIISLSFTLTLLEKKVRQVVLEINSGNKDRDLSFSHYEEEIHQFFTLLRYKKLDDGYLPTGLGRIQSNKISIEKDPLSLMIEGPESIISILCESLKTPGSSFVCKKKEDIKSSF
ncbi:hypothetical protein M900_A0351 [Bacteriovorax sp. Seq25_V]|nr:hypothetical protein M900_A0351 [Bacteriovorax sp. Seq25_V]